LRVGVLGGGQLARMLAIAGERIGVATTCLDPAPDACAGQVAKHICAAWDDPGALDALAAASDVVTFEFENVPPASLERLAPRVTVRPSAEALRVSADRLAEKNLFRALGSRTAEFAAIAQPSDADSAARAVGAPAILKTRHSGYDGKGQRRIGDAGELASAWRAAGSVPCILEAMVPFRREVSIIAVRGLDGALAFYPLSENTHRDGILHIAVSRPGDPLQAPAEAVATRLMEKLGYVGVLAIEFFDVDGELLVNEFAPRVHNSGHWSIEGAETSQFENHLRAVLGMPLGSTAPTGCAAMVNFVGQMPDAAEVLRLPGARLHAYGKAPRPGRKLGHATVLDSDPARCGQLAAQLAGLA